MVTTDAGVVTDVDVTASSRTTGAKFAASGGTTVVGIVVVVEFAGSGLLVGAEGAGFLHVLTLWFCSSHLLHGIATLIFLTLLLSGHSMGPGSFLLTRILLPFSSAS